MKQALNILIAYLTCTDPVIQNKWLNLLSSFWHKDSGWLLKSITAQAGGYKFTIVDSDGNDVDHIISVPALPNSQPISYIQDLQTTLDNKVDKAAGKGLSTNDFTTTLKTKLDGLVNYVHPEFHQISEIEGLQALLDTLAVYDDLALVAKTNDYNDLQNKPLFKVVENEYADMAALFADQANQTDSFIQYVLDASAHPDVAAGSAYFEYLGSIIGDENDYRLLSDAESAPLSTSVTKTSQLVNDGEGASRFIQESEISKVSLQAPFLEELIPDTYLPSSTGNFILKGAYFVPAMCDGTIPNAIQISGGDNIIHYCTFINDNEIRVNLTTSATEGNYDVTLNNGVSATFVGVLQVVNGTVYEPTSADWVNPTGSIDTSKTGALNLTVYYASGDAKWTQLIDMSKDFEITWNMKKSPLSTTEGLDYNAGFEDAIRIKKLSDDSTVWVWKNYRNDYLSLYDSVGVEKKNTNSYKILPNGRYRTVSCKYIGGIWYFYYDGDLLWTGGASVNSVDSDMYLVGHVKGMDIENIKYIDLSDTGGALPDRINDKAKYISVDAADFDGNLAPADNTVQKALQKFNDFKGSNLNVDALDLSSLSEYADDAAAATGGIAVGFAYINSATGALQKRLA